MIEQAELRLEEASGVIAETRAPLVVHRARQAYRAKG
jgi:hypothetical protein